MLKIEKKLILWVEKHMLWLLVLLAAVMGLYLRKIAVWWGAPDINSYFDSHAGNIQSAFYYLLVQLSQYLPLLPLHSVKWLAGMADYIVAALCFVAVGGRGEGLRAKGAFYLVVCILSPVVFLRGICWAQVDALAFGFLVGALILWEKEKRGAATALAAFGTALYPCFLLLALGWMLCGKEKRQGRDWICFGALAAGCCLIQGLSGLAMGQPWGESLASCVRWAAYEPCLGTVYQTPLQWAARMVSLFGYGAAMTAGMAAYRHRIPYVTALVIHLAVLLVYGSFLFPAAL